jgi:osmotically-inducible protein OsmY
MSTSLWSDRPRGVQHDGVADMQCCKDIDANEEQYRQMSVTAQTASLRAQRAAMKNDARRIRRDVRAAFVIEPLLRSSDIVVTVAEYRVTLAGYVATDLQRCLATSVAERVPGVAAVDNRIWVVP